MAITALLLDIAALVCAIEADLDGTLAAALACAVGASAGVLLATPQAAPAMLRIAKLADHSRAVQPLVARFVQVSYVRALCIRLESAARVSALLVQ